jgi:enoyl-CoA hydratase
MASPAVAVTIETRQAPVPKLDNVLYEKRNGIAYVTLNRPKVLNALNTPTWTDLRTAFEDARDDAAVRGAILTGAGDKAFIAGADISELAHASAIDAERSSRSGQEMLNLIENLGKPVIAAINGFALGGGCETAMACTIRIAVEHAKFGQPEVKLGLLPGGGGTQRLPRLVGKARALQLILSGEMISAQEAYRIGLVNEIVPAADLIARAEAILKKIASNARSPSSSRSRQRTREWTRARAKDCCWRLPTSVSVPPPRTRRRARRPSSKSARLSSTGGDRRSFRRDTNGKRQHFFWTKGG